MNTERIEQEFKAQMDEVLARFKVETDNLHSEFKLMTLELEQKYDKAKSELLKSYEDKLNNVKVPSSPFKDRKADETYWFIGYGGEVIDTQEELCDRDTDMFKFGNYFSSEEHATRYSKRLKLFLELEKYAYEEGLTRELIVDNTKTTHRIVCDSATRNLSVISSQGPSFSPFELVFPTKESAQQAIESLGNLIIELYEDVPRTCSAPTCTATTMPSNRITPTPILHGYMFDSSCINEDDCEED